MIQTIRPALALALALLASQVQAATAERKSFGTMPDGTSVDAVTLANDKGMKLTVISLGASLQALSVPDRKGRFEDVVLGYDTLAGYVERGSYFGSIVGRVGNRIAKGTFVLDGKRYQVPVNNGVNTLHGGPRGFDKVVWEVVSVKSGPTASVTMRYVSPDGDMGFPGKLVTTATYSLDAANRMHVDIDAVTDAPTVVNLTNHAYWNLAGAGSHEGALGHVLTIPAQTYLPTDDGLIPTGEFRPVAGTVFDFRKPTRIDLRVRNHADEQIRNGRGYDHNWVVSRTPPKGMQLMARVLDPRSGRTMEIHSDQPGVQFYSGNFFDGTTYGKGGKAYRQGDCVVLEPQGFPDTPNRPEFGSVRLDPGQRYKARIVYAFGVLPKGK